MILAPIQNNHVKLLLVLGAGLLAVATGMAISIQSELTFYLLVLVAAIAFHFTLPQYTIAPFLLISFYVPAYTKVDVAAALFFLSASIYFFRKKCWYLLRETTILRPLLLIAVLVIVSTLFGFALGKNLIQDIYRDGRIFFYWLLLIPLLAWTPRTNSIRWLANNMLFIGVRVCLLAIVQGTFAVRLVDTGLVADLDTMNMQSMSTVRVQIPGFMFAMFALSYVTALLLGRAWSAIPLLLLFCILSLGIIFNFGRALWFWTFVSLIIVAAQYGSRGVVRFFAWVTIPAIIGLAALSVAKPDLFETIGHRISSVAEEGNVGSSYGWRELENQEGLKSLQNSYFLGVAMGGKYRRFNEMLANFPDHTIYTHNGHLYLTLKLSIFGLLAYLWLGKRVVQTIAKSPKRSPVEQAISASAIAFTVAFFGINITQPEIMSHYGLVALVFICAIAFFMNYQARLDGGSKTKASAPDLRSFQDTVPSELVAA